MATIAKSSSNSTLPLAGALLPLSASLLGVCVAAPPPPPPPPRVYVRPAPPPPPPPAYDEPAPAGDGAEITANEAPPPLPDYEQPPAPDEGYLWTPGYWAWGGGGGYYWVPGTW